jgi:hypothetical protein
VILDPAVSLTDFALSVECGWFAAYLYRRALRRDLLFRAFVAFFVSTGSAALLGGVTHGFLPDATSLLHRLAWTGTLLAIGMAACAAWIIGAQLCLSGMIAKQVMILAAFSFVFYAGVVLLVSQSFVVAIAYYLPAAAFLLVAFSAAYRRERSSGPLSGAIGVALTFVAAGIQQSGTGLPLLSLTYNALYHVVQAIALLLIFLGARDILIGNPR